MKKSFAPFLLLAGLIGALVAAFVVQPVSAHQTIAVGNYQVEIGWLDEPPIVGQRNAIVVNISLAAPASTPAASGAAPADGKAETIDISRLDLNVVYGGVTKTLTLQPLSEDSQNQYVAPILPTRPGKYTVTLTGMLGTTAANAAVQPEEVETADNLQFPPAAEATVQPGGPDLSVVLAAAALLVGLVALGISVISWRKTGGKP